MSDQWDHPDSRCALSFGLDTIVSTCPIAVEGGLYRPSFICFVRPHLTRVIHLYWDEPGPREVLPLFLSNPPPGVEPARGVAP